MNSASAVRKDKLLSLALNPKEAASYSLGRALQSAIDGTACFERDVHETLEASLGRPPRALGIYAPTCLRPQASGADTKTSGAGGFLVRETILDLVDALRSQMRLAQLGATLIPNLKFAATFGAVDTTTSTSWVGENPGSDVPESSMTFRAVTASPKTVQSTIQISRQLLGQTADNPALEQRIRMDLMAGIAHEFDRAALCGSGVNGQPIGLLQTAGIGSVVIGPNGGVPTYATVCDLEAAVSNANAPDAIAWLTSPNVRRLLRKTYQNGGGSAPVWADERLLGHPAVVSTNVPQNLSRGSSIGTLSAIVCGAWPELYLCDWGAVELTVDKFSKIRQGMVEISSFLMVDSAVPRPASFAVCLDAALA